MRNLPKIFLRSFQNVGPGDYSLGGTVTRAFDFRLRGRVFAFWLGHNDSTPVVVNQAM